VKLSGAFGMEAKDMTTIEIRGKVNALIQEATLNKKNFSESINWADLNCIDVVPYSLGGILHHD
jgi:hypothetical protein